MSESMDKVFQFHMTPERKYEEYKRGRWTHIDISRRSFIKWTGSSEPLNIYQLNKPMPVWLVLFIIDNRLFPRDSFVDPQGNCLSSMNLENLDTTVTYTLKG